MNKAYVVDGVVIRQKTDDTHPDSPDYPSRDHAGAAVPNASRSLVQIA